MAKRKTVKPVDHLGDLSPDPKNARKHNPRNIGMVVDSLQSVGAARSIVIDENNVVLCGNGVVEAAGEAGITRVQVVDADGETIVAVRRSGLSAAQKQRLALFDNRTAELADWDADVLAALRDDGLLDGLWFEDELSALLAQSTEVESDSNRLRDEYSPNIGEVIYEPKETNHKPGDLFSDAEAGRFEADIAAIGNKALQPLLRRRAAFFTAFNFSKIADYYAYQATPEEKRLFERLALVLLDRDQLIANGFAQIIEEVKEENGFNEAGTDAETDERE